MSAPTPTTPSSSPPRCARSPPSPRRIGSPELPRGPGAASCCAPPPGARAATAWPAPSCTPWRVTSHPLVRCSRPSLDRMRPALEQTGDLDLVTAGYERLLGATGCGPPARGVREDGGTVEGVVADLVDRTESVWDPLVEEDARPHVGRGSHVCRLPRNRAAASRPRPSVSTCRNVTSLDPASNRRAAAAEPSNLLNQRSRHARSACATCAGTPARRPRCPRGRRRRWRRLAAPGSGRSSGVGPSS